MSIKESLKMFKCFNTHTHTHSYLEDIIRNPTSLLWTFNYSSGSFLTIGLTCEGFFQSSCVIFCRRECTTAQPQNLLEWREFCPFPIDSKEVGGKVIATGLYLVAWSHKLLSLLLPPSPSSLMMLSMKHVIALDLWGLKGSWTLMYKRYLIKIQFLVFNLWIYTYIYTHTVFDLHVTFYRYIVSISNWFKSKDLACWFGLHNLRKRLDSDIIPNKNSMNSK